MYVPESNREHADSAVDFYNSKEDSPTGNNTIIQISDGSGATTSGGDDPAAAANQSSSVPPPPSPAPKKRAEPWAQEETRALIFLRKEIDLLFNTSKSNKHLWDNISMKMREKGFDRSRTMCTDKWRNLLKEYKKVTQNNQDVNGNVNVKMNFFKDIDEIMRERSKNGNCWKNSETSNDAATASKVDSFEQFYDKGIDDASLLFGPVEGNVSRSTLNVDRCLDHEAHPLAITAADAVGASGASPWCWRETSGNGEQRSCDGRVITVKLGDYAKRIGINGTADAIKEAIKSAFRLRTKRAFWLEDGDNVVRSLDRDMPLGNYMLHLDEGLMIRVCVYERADHLPVHTEEKTFYTDDDFRDFLNRRRWACLREFGGFRNIDTLDELCPGAVYRGVVHG